MTRSNNIKYRFLQNWKLATSLLLFSTLLTFSSHSFSQNLVNNPGFENGTNGWTLAEDASAQYTESSGRSGDRLTHWSSSATYTASTSQTVSGLAAGTYRLSLYTVGGSTTSASLWAACDDMVFSSPIPASPWGSWAQVVVDNISVSGGSGCELGVTTQDSEWSSFDDVVFEQVSGGGTAITVRASGTSGEESVSLQVGGTTVETWTLSTSMQNYEAITELDGEIRVAFTNDASGRDVQVNYIDVNGETRQAEDQSENTGVWDGSCGGGSHSEWLHCNGYISFGNLSGGGGGPIEIVIQEGVGFCDVDGSVDSNHAGYTGNGFANTDNVSGTGVDWKVKVPSSGSYTLEWRYANGGSASRPGSVLINGSSVATVDFPVTGAWATWATVSANISLSAGENSIRLQATGSAGLGNIDSLTVAGNSPQAVNCGDTGGTSDFILGADISMAQGQGPFTDTDGQSKSMFDLLKNHGFNYIRLKTFVDPTAADWNGCSGSTEGSRENVIAYGAQAKSAGMGFLLDFHYSDIWADPGNQIIPEAWRGATTEAEMADYVENYTYDVVSSAIAAGARPDMVQVGNEITHGMLHDFPGTNTDCWGNNPTDAPHAIAGWVDQPQFISYLKAGIQGVHRADPSIEIVLHTERPREAASWLARVVDAGVDVDIFGLSCYESFQGGYTVCRDTFEALIADSRFDGIDFVVAEYNPQRTEMNLMTRDLANDRGRGTFFWEPTAGGSWGPAMFNGTTAIESAFDEYDALRSELGL